MPSTSPQLTLEQAYRQIEVFMQQEQWLDAYRGCLEILRFDPENPRIFKLKRKIEKIVHHNNVRAVKADLKHIKHLWKQRQYLQYLEEVKKLEPYLSDYPPLKNILFKAEHAYQTQIAHSQADYYHQELQRIQELAHQKKFQEALESAEKLKAQKFYPEEVTKLLHALQEEWIDFELQTHTDLIHSEKYEDILLFYQKLLAIAPSNNQVAKLIMHTKKRYQGYKLEEQKEFIYKSLEHIRTLYQLKKYDKALAAAREILQLDPANKEAKKFYQQSLKKIKKLTHREVIEQMLTNQKQMRMEYSTAPKIFVRF